MVPGENLPKPVHVSWIEVDLTALAHNVRQIRNWVGPRVQVWAVVKANAYGHGMVPVARAALKAGAAGLVVHRVHEGVRLRQAGVRAPILLLGYTPLEAVPLVVQYRLTPTVLTTDFVDALNARAPRGFPVHVKVDTGLGRFGLLPHEVVGMLTYIQQYAPNLYVEGLYTHFATADEADPSYLRRQWAVFQQVMQRVAEAGFHIPLKHACNSAALFALPEAHLDAVRPGIALYGLRPSLAWETPVPLRPVLALKSRVVRVRVLPPGSSIGYGRTYITPKAQRVALVPVGYGDGYLRALSNRAYVLIRGRRARVLGRVSMDQIVVDVDAIPGVAMEDEVVLIGRQGDERITAEEVAAWAGTINYEITTLLQERLPRFYHGLGASEAEARSEATGDASKARSSNAA